MNSINIIVCNQKCVRYSKHSLSKSAPPDSSQHPSVHQCVNQSAFYSFQGSMGSNKICLNGCTVP